jgi:hypothetical protein
MKLRMDPGTPMLGRVGTRQYARPMPRVRGDQIVGCRGLALSLLVAFGAAPTNATAQSTPPTVGPPAPCLSGSPENPVIQAAGAGFGGIWLSPPVNGTQRANLALVTGTDETPVREALRECGTDQVTDIRAAAYPYSAVLAAHARFDQALADGAARAGVVGFGIGVDHDRFVVTVTLLNTATPAQEAAIRTAAESVTSESGVPVLIAELRSAPVTPTPGTPPASGNPSAASPVKRAAPLPLTTRSSLRRAQRTGVVRLTVRRPVDAITVTLHTTSGSRITVGRGRSDATPRSTVVRIKLTPAGRRHIARRSKATLRVTVTAPGATTTSRRIELR